MQPTLALQLYVQHKCAGNLRPGSVTNVQRFILRFIKDSHLIDIEQFTSELVVNHLVTLLKTCKPVTVAGHRAVIIAWHVWLIDEGILIDKPMHKKVPKIKGEKKQPRFLTKDQCERLLLTAQVLSHNTVLARKRDYAMLLTLIDTGVRVGELCNMLLSDLDIDSRTIRIDQACKGRKERSVVFGQTTARAIRHYLRVRGHHNSPYLWVTRDTPQPSRSLILQIIKRLGRAAGVPWLTVHGLRHTCITSLVRSGLALPLVQQQAGHANISTTLGYTHLGIGDLKEQYDDHSPVGCLGK